MAQQEEEVLYGIGTEKEIRKKIGAKAVYKSHDLSG